MFDNSKDIILLAIETSCDDTSIAVLRNEEILSNITYSQIIHKKYGGVVPEAASRKHIESITLVCKKAMEEANMDFLQLDGIAVTRGPGLMGSLLVGVAFAKGLALSLHIPLIEVNHLEAHVWSLFIDHPPVFPKLCMTVSGGHTQLLVIHAGGKIEILGQTLDDAAGEAFDKIGKLFNLPYPAGPLIDRLAQNGKAIYSFPKAKVPDFNFSFSGLKTSVLYFLRTQIKMEPQFIENNLADLCASIQLNIVDTLVEKLMRAAQEYSITDIGIAGGVSANSGLRNKLKSLAEQHHWNLILPELKYCTDNAAMIGRLAFEKYKRKEFASLDILPLPRFPILQIQQ